MYKNNVKINEINVHIYSSTYVNKYNFEEKSAFNIYIMQNPSIHQ